MIEASLQSESQENYKADSLASGLSFTLVTNIVQRGIGFVRNVALCHFLSDGQLGLWAIASGFFVLAAPLAVLGLPGCFGKFVEYYRVRGQLPSFVRRITMGAVLGSLFFFALLVCFSDFSSRVVFGETLSRTTMASVGLVLLIVTLFNFAVELFGGLRQPRTVSSMLLINSLAFTVLAIGSCLVRPDWMGLVIAFGISSLLGLYPAVRIWLRQKTTGNEHVDPSSSIDVWKRIVPYAISMWMMNLLVNLFEVVDRYMLLYLMRDGEGLAQRTIGQFHSARLLPVLLFSLAAVVSGMLLPYLSADWEKNRQDRVANSTHAAIKFSAIGFTGFAVYAMALAPFLFRFLLSDRFALGQEVMPVAMVCCLWTSLTMIAQNYLWCAEKTRAITISLAIGLVVNVILNWQFIPAWGLHGAVWATTIASAVNLGLVIWSLHLAGCRFAKSLIVFMTLPVLIAFSTEAAAIGLAALIWISGRTNWLLSREEKEIIENALRPMFARLNWNRPCFVTST